MSTDLRKQVSEGQFNEFYVAIETLIKFNIECTRDGNDELIIRYHFGNGNYKECRPRSADKWKTVNRSKEKNPPFGYHQLPPKGKLVVITGGEKDVLAFDMFGIPAISMQSETVNIPLSLITELRQRFDKILICYDIDETGVKFSKKWEKYYGLPRIELPDDLDGKDIYDFKASGRTKEELHQLIKLAIKTQQENKTSFTGKEIMESKASFDFIIKDILPKSNLVGLIGGSDTGKSLLLLQFSISYILNKSFLDGPVKGGKKVLFFSFEDDSNSIKKRLSKLVANFPEGEKEMVFSKIFFELDPDRIEQKIENFMELNPDTGIIIIDPLTEILAGTDMNNPASVREQMQLLKKVSMKYDLAVIFINHVTKSSEDSKALSKANSIGSQAIESKSRVMFEMKKHTKSYPAFIELGIVKGNDIDAKFKSPEFTLFLKQDPETLWFSKAELVSPVNKSTTIDWMKVFGDNQLMRTNEILQKASTEYSMTWKQVEKLISSDLGQYRVEKGLYANPKFSRQ
ncbi:AAA domain-containing protein [Algoriphagus boseongensis]|uniref:AAA domain-containing protein n=1 Tax=Algoriphagus boseongensis TaxID=1442587 RepID=A0A4R6T357_9BACT|nr:bifunctional DNA primase/helicase [Algoriphagus boseongensis]TDQ15208.1 AAA domain-containing protein [Algoriphagus boseongensis]